MDLAACAGRGRQRAGGARWCGQSIFRKGLGIGFLIGLWLLCYLCALCQGQDVVVVFYAGAAHAACVESFWRTPGLHWRGAAAKGTGATTLQSLLDSLKFIVN